MFPALLYLPLVHLWTVFTLYVVLRSTYIENTKHKSSPAICRQTLVYPYCCGLTKPLLDLYGYNRQANPVCLTVDTLVQGPLAELLLGVPCLVPRVQTHVWQTIFQINQ